MRIFIAFKFDENLKTRIALIQNKVRNLSKKGRWTQRDNFHLTIKFLGDTKLDNYKMIEKELSKALSSVNAVKLSLDDLGTFTRTKEIRVLWLGLKGDTKYLEKINFSVEEKMHKLGFKKENRVFKPHITLGRNIILNEEFERAKEMIREDCNYSFVLDKVSIMESKLINGRRVYIPLKNYNLKEPL